MNEMCDLPIDSVDPIVEHEEVLLVALDELAAWTSGDPPPSQGFCGTLAANAAGLIRRYQLEPYSTQQLQQAVERAAEAGLISVRLAQVLDVCRLCGENARPRQHEDGGVDSFNLEYGQEHAHESCLKQETLKSIKRARMEIASLIEAHKAQGRRWARR